MNKRKKFMTTLLDEAKEQLKIISAKERKPMNIIIEELIFGYYEPIEPKDYLFLVDGIEMPQPTGVIKEKGGFEYMARDVIYKLINILKKDKATIVDHVDGERIYIGSVYKGVNEEGKNVWYADVKNCPRIEFEIKE